MLRGTRRLLLAEGRTIGSTLRREYPKLFAFRVDEGNYLLVITFTSFAKDKKLLKGPKREMFVAGIFTEIRP